MANQVLIDIMNENKHDAGTKARNDVTRILNNMGFVTVSMFNRTHGKFRRAIEVLLASYKIGKKINQKELIVLQYPYKPAVMNVMLSRIKKIRKNKKCELVILIHDVTYLRNDDEIYTNVNNMMKIEVDFFNQADYLIVHNDKMKEALLSAGVTANMYPLNLFDYLYDGKGAELVDNNTTIVYAGNLSKRKSGFLYDYKGDVAFNIYGSKPDELSSTMTYKGSFSPDMLIENLEGSYGLIWDGPSASTCTGNYGEYLKYNNPHKCSLYIAAGLPVVVWKNAAIAELIQKEKLGICVDSLDEITNLPVPSSKEYQEMLVNILKYQSKLNSGEMLKQTIRRIEDM